MATAHIDQDLVILRAAEMPGFPRVISEILATLDDPEANLTVLAQLIERDAVIAARVLSLANMAATRTRRLSEVRDVFTATSLIGMGRVRQLAVIGSCLKFFAGNGADASIASHSRHSVAVAVCAEELALWVAIPVSSTSALIAGLLHDIGQLWLSRFGAGDYREVWSQALSHAIGIERAERERFGTDHARIGAWLGEHWGLPADIVAAIRHHHDAATATVQPLAATVHVAEVLSNALDLTGRSENHVTHISPVACRALGIAWNDPVRPLFGRIEARSRHANAFFAEPN